MEPDAAIAVAVTSVIGTLSTRTPSASISMLFVVATNCRPFADAVIIKQSRQQNIRNLELTIITNVQAMCKQCDI